MTNIGARYQLTLKTPLHAPPAGLWTPSHSWLKQFLQIMRVHLQPSTDNNVRDRSNILRTVTPLSGLAEMSVEGMATFTHWGPLVGSGVTAEDPQDYELATLITHGAGAGQLQYATATISALTIDASNIYLDIARVLTNTSGGNVTVREVGLACLTQGNYFLLIRDVLVTPIVVPDTGILTLTYRILTTN